MPRHRPRARAQGSDRMVKPRAIIPLLLLFGCRTTPQINEPRYPALAPARAPDDARTLAPQLKDPLLAAQVAWLMGNDRALARAQIDRGLDGPDRHSLHLLRALIGLAELDREGSLG